MPNQPSHIAVKHVLIPMLAIVPLIVYFVFFSPSLMTFLEMVIVVAMIPIFVLDDLTALLALVIIRPMVDIFGSQSLLSIQSLNLNLASVMSLLVIAWSILLLIRRHSAIWRRPFIGPMVFLFMVGAFGLTYTVSFSATITELLRLGSMFLIFLVAMELLSSGRAVNLFRRSIAWSLLVPGAVAIGQWLTHTGLSFSDVANRVYGTFGHPNVLAYYLVVSLVMLIPLYLSRRQEDSGPLPLIIIAALGLLVLTLARGAVIGLLVVGLVLGLVRYRKVLAFVASITLAVVLLFPVVNSVTTNAVDLDLRRTTLVERLLNKTDDSSLDFRFQLWNDMKRKIAERPVLGFGLGTFPILREQQIILFFQSTEAHNDYLRLAVETGLVGLAAYLLLLLAIGWRLWQTFRRLRGSPEQVYLLAMLGLWVAMLVMSYFDNMLQGTPVMWLWWMMIAASLNLPHLTHMAQPRKKKTPAIS